MQIVKDMQYKTPTAYADIAKVCASSSLQKVHVKLLNPVRIVKISCTTGFLYQNPKIE